MADQKQQWLIKDADGKVHGPYDRDSLFSLIEKGALTGVEQVAEYPSGDYSSISQNIEFYDKFLEVWESEVGGLSKEQKKEALKKEERKNKAKKNANIENTESTVNTKTGADEDSAESFKPKNNIEEAQSISFVDDVSNFDKDAKTNDYAEEDSAYGIAQKQSSYRRDGKESSFRPEDADKITKSGITRNKKREYERVDDRRKRSPKQFDLKTRFMFIIVAVLIAVIIYDDHPAEKMREDKRIHLSLVRLPKKKQKIPPKELFGIKRKALDLIAKDNFKSYESAMELLTTTIQRMGSENEVLGLLCTTYKELWQYSHRDSRDLASISRATQIVSRGDIGGVSSSYCRAVQFYLAGNLHSAEQTLISALENFPRTSVLYALQADIYYLKGDKAKASAFYQKTAELWPEWNKASFWLANIYKENAQFEYAANLYTRLINSSNFHSLAAIELAEIETFNRGNMEYAEELLSEAIDAGKVIPRIWQSKAFYILAVIAEQKNSIDQAIKYVTRAYELNTRNNIAKTYLVRLAGPEALSKLFKTEIELLENGDLFFRQGNYLAAQAEYKAAFELNEENAIAGLKAAESLWKLNQSDEAIRWLKKSVKANPKDLDTRLLLAKYHVERYNFSGAMENLREAKRLGKNDYRIHRAYAHFELARNNLKAAVDFAEKAIRIYDTDIESHLIITEALLKMQSYDQAYKMIARAVGLEPSNVKAQSLYAEVLAYHQGSNLATKYITNLINTYPSEMHYRLALAKIYLNDLKFQEAKSILKPVTDTRAEFKPAFLLLAKAYEGLGDATGALTAYLGAASLDPTDAMPLVEIGLLYMATGKPKRAAENFQRALKLNKKFPRLNFYLGEAYLAMNQTKLAVEQAILERQQNPMLADSYVLAADAYRKMAKYNDAIAEYQKAVQRRPQSAEIYVKMAICYRLIGNLDVSEQMLVTAKSKESGYPEIYKETGAILEKKGKALEAIQAYRRYLSLKPGAKDADIIRIRIQALGG